MAKKITITGKAARRINVTGKSQRRVDPNSVATTLGAEGIGESHSRVLDPIALAALGSRLIARLRSTGGRPALTDATEFCRVPLSADDLKALEKITEEIAETSGMKPSLGQLASTIVRDHLTGECAVRRQSQGSPRSRPQWPEPLNHRRENYRAIQNLIEHARSTWGTNAA